MLQYSHLRRLQDLYKSLCNRKATRQSISHLCHGIWYLHWCICYHNQLRWGYHWVDDDLHWDHFMSVCVRFDRDLVHDSDEQVGYDLWTTSCRNTIRTTRQQPRWRQRNKDSERWNVRGRKQKSLPPVSEGRLFMSDIWVESGWVGKRR
jgi:hypothetical protein